MSTTRTLLAVGAAAMALALAGCGTSTSPSAGTSPAANQSSNAPSPAGSLPGCTIYAQQHDAQIDVTPDQGECNELIKDLAGGDAF